MLTRDEYGQPIWRSEDLWMKLNICPIADFQLEVRIHGDRVFFFYEEAFDLFWDTVDDLEE